MKQHEKKNLIKCEIRLICVIWLSAPRYKEI